MPRKKPQKRGRGHDKTGRSKSDGQFASMPYPMLRSAAWRSLKGPAIKVFLELHTRYWGGNNGELSLSLGEAARILGIGKATAQAAFDELIEKGFIEMTKQGHWYGRVASEYRITKERTGRENATNEWRIWQPPDAEKTESGSQADPSASATDRCQNPRRMNGSG